MFAILSLFPGNKHTHKTTQPRVGVVNKNEIYFLGGAPPKPLTPLRGEMRQSEAHSSGVVDRLSFIPAARLKQLTSLVAPS